MSGQHLHRHGEHPEEAPAQARLLAEAVQGQEYERRPNQRAQVRQVPRINVQEVPAAEHKHRRRQEACERAQAVMRGPQEHENATEKNMERDAPVNGWPRRRDEEQYVGRVKQGGLKAAEIGRAGEKVGVPQRQVPLPQFAEAKRPPV